MGADEGRIGDALTVVVDVRQLALGGSRRHRPLLAVGKACHFQLDLRLGDEGADFRQAEAWAKAIEGDHVSAPNLLNRRLTLATPCCHHGVSSGDTTVQMS
jgi:hypothetical protein